MATLKSFSVTSLGAVLIVLGTAIASPAADFFGNSQPLGNGFVRSIVTLDNNGNPLEIGVAFTPGALSLPTGDVPDVVTQLSLPLEASATAFNHIELTYRPNAVPGNPPAFGVPRFGIDFFLLSSQERALICPNPDTTGSVPTCVGDELAQVLKTPDPGLVPEGLLPTGVAEPKIGTRYFDPDIAFPIASGQQPFNSVYDYGFFDGKLSFMDVAVTKAFLETKPTVTNPIKLPASYFESGYYPTAYKVTYDASSQEYRISYTGLTYRSVPEVSATWGLLAFGTWGAVSLVKNQLQKQK
jgi:Domain of unknown function (DUF5602)